jgi:thioredoxin 2
VDVDRTTLIRCPACGVTNRVQAGKRGPVCGRCHSPLDAGTAPVTVSDASFPELVERSPLPVLLDAWAPWCGPCRMLAPTIDELASELAGRLRVGKLNVDENPQTAARFALRSIPTLLLFQDGKEVDRIVGLLPKPEIARRLERWVR